MNEQQKIYIFVAHTIATIGGMEMYTAGRAKYLESCGWKVYVLSPEAANSKTAIPSLSKYLKIGGDCTFLLTPPYKFKRYEQEQMLNFMIQNLNLPDIANCKIIVESCSGARACWAELLAAILQAQHFFIASEEGYREKWQVYDEILPFMYFKLMRNEMVGSDETIRRLFNGYKNVTGALVEIPNVIREQDAIQDVDYPTINQIEKLDWNICHIGRITKNFVIHFIIGVAELALRYPDKKINLMFVGEVDPLKNVLMKTFENIDNVQLTALGMLVPIPRILFSKVDVVCAIAQSARFAANEGVLTIVGSTDNLEKTRGVLGYDTNEQTFGSGNFSYCEALENVLVKRLYDDQKYSLPKLKPAEEYYARFSTIFENANPNKEYYVEELMSERIRNWAAVFPFGSISRGARVIFFGATEIAKDYKKQIESQQDANIEIGEDYIKNFVPKPYCKILAIVDEHPENFDDAVSGVERLKQKDYDAILITVFPQQAQEVYNKIVQTVPDMANRIVYALKTIQI